MKNSSIVILASLGAAVLVLLVGLINGSNTQEPRSHNSAHRNAELRMKIIAAPNNTYGYDILKNGRILIHQPQIPALPGNEGFKTEEKAEKVAEFVIHKIRQNIFPPSITIQELDSLGVL
jgi:hypothetical protein